MDEVETIELVARHIFKFFYHDVEWGHTGTVDDETWRDFEEGCLDTARELLDLKDSKGERVLFTQEEMQESKSETACALFEEIICPMCYKLNPQHAAMDNYKGCHCCQEREDWNALKEGK